MATIDAGVEVRTVTAQPLTVEAFKPFGDVISVEGRERLPIDLYGDAVDVFRADFEADEPIEFLLTRGKVRPFEVLFLERHFNLTQTFFPMGGVPFISVVAAPDARLEDEVPATEDVRAFIVPGSVAVNLHKGTWHEPPFPLVDGQVIAYTSHAALTAGLGSNLDARKNINQLDVDKRNIKENAGYRLRVTLP